MINCIPETFFLELKCERHMSILYNEKNSKTDARVDVEDSHLPLAVDFVVHVREAGEIE